MTRWGRALDPAHVLPEHPRPQLERDSWLNLNGWWDHAVTGLDAAPPTEWDGRILVPFSPEAPRAPARASSRPPVSVTGRRPALLSGRPSSVT